MHLLQLVPDIDIAQHAGIVDFQFEHRVLANENHWIAAPALKNRHGNVGAFPNGRHEGMMRVSAVPA